jgi:hypothetical protein
MLRSGLRMAMRLVKVSSEENLLLSLQHGVWGARRDILRSWRPNDEIAFVVGKNLAALAQVTGSAFENTDLVWHDDEYRYRIPITFKHFTLAGERPPLLGDVREALIAAFGPKWSFAMITQTPILAHAADTIVRTFANAPNQLAEAQRALATLLDQASIAQEVEKTSGRTIVSPVSPSTPDAELTDASAPEESLHTRAQGALIELGRAARCSVWVASNDRGKIFKGSPLIQKCIAVLPGMGLSAEAVSRISLIDVLWLQHNAPAYAFEIEVTTSVYSGLLRMSDLLAVVPALKMNLYVVAPVARREKVLSEMGRPTFRRIGLNDYCKFIPLEALEALNAKVDDAFKGFVHPGIVEQIAEELQDGASEETA